MKLSTLIAVGLCAGQAALAKPCPSFEAAKGWYFDGRVGESRAALRCLKESYPEDLDVRRLLSDLYWWQGEVDTSVQEAREAQQLKNFNVDRETAIHLTRRASNFSLAGTLEGLLGAQSGHELHAQLDWRFQRRDHLIGRIARLARVFNGTAAQADSLFGLEYSRVQGERSYILANAGFSPTHVFSPVWSAGLEPHYTLHDDSDVGVEARYSHYVDTDVVLISPGWRHVYGLWTASGRVLLTVAGALLPSAQVSLAYALGASWTPQLSVAGGQALEQAHLQSNFYAVSADVAYQIRPDLVARVLGTIYRATVRSENRIGVGGQWLF